MPQAIASTITMPNGSAQRIGISSARAPRVELALALLADLADVAHRVVVDVRLHLAAKNSSWPGWHRPRQHQRNVGGACRGDRPLRSLVVVHARDPQQIPVRALRERPFIDRQRVVDHRDVVAQMLRRRGALGRADRDELPFAAVAGVEAEQVRLERAVQRVHERRLQPSAIASAVKPV